MKESKLTVVAADSPSVEPKRRRGEPRAIAHRIAAVAVAFATMTGTVVLPQTAGAAPSGSSTAVSDGAKRLNTRAKELYEAGNLRASAETYAEILDELSENNVNREERDNVILLTVEVYIEAYEARRLEKDDKALPEAVALLERAVQVFDGYEAEYRRVYGGTSISPEAAASGQRLKALLEQAKKEYTPPPAAEPEKEAPVIFPSGPEIDVPSRRRTHDQAGQPRQGRRDDRSRSRRDRSARHHGQRAHHHWIHLDGSVRDRRRDDARHRYPSSSALHGVHANGRPRLRGAESQWAVLNRIDVDPL
jgi:tetratricopeptide (TPR) repeat protein